MLTKIITAAIGLMIALMLLRFFSGRAHRAELRLRAEARRQREAEREADADPGAHVRPDAAPDSLDPGSPQPGSPRSPGPERKPNSVTTLEVDPETGVYRPKG